MAMDINRHGHGDQIPTSHSVITSVAADRSNN
jgi:hypothetical protein